MNTVAPEPHIGDHARNHPDKPAVIMSDNGEVLTYAQLDARSNALAGQLAAAGVRVGDHVAILMSNCPDFLVATWAAHRSGLYYTPVNWHLTADEVAYIVQDCGARVLLMDDRTAAVADPIAVAAPQVQIWRCDGQGPSGFTPRAGEAPAPALYEAVEGSSMIYSSGTSGRPKGIKRDLPGAPFGIPGPGDHMVRGLFGFASDTVLLCPSPLYHAAPMNFCMSAHRCGGTAVLMRAFDPEEALTAIERYGVTEAWLVPTMMIRMLKLPEARKAAADVSSLRHAVHSAAPCPVETKQALMAWWGPVLYEFYAATEGNGLTSITPQEWLERPGSVGKSDNVRIVAEDGELQPAGEVGVIYFANPWTKFEYHNDAAKTAEAHDRHGWSTIGDMGYLDAEGYLYLTDRKSHMIISGGVNIYPQEAENVLAAHPRVEDVAVIGVPHPEYGEEVKAVVQAHGEPSDALAEELIEFCRERLARYKCPRTVDFVDSLPRLPTGKLLKRDLRARYWPKKETVI